MIKRLIDTLEIYERREFNPALHAQQCNVVDAWLFEEDIEAFCKGNAWGMDHADILDQEKAELVKNRTVSEANIELTILDPAKLVVLLQAFKEQKKHDTLYAYLAAHIVELEKPQPPNVSRQPHPLGKDLKAWGFQSQIKGEVKPRLKKILERHKFTGMHTPAPEGEFRRFMRKEGVPRNIQYLIHRMLSPNPTDRPGIIEVIEQLGKEYGFHIITNEDGHQVTASN